MNELNVQGLPKLLRSVANTLENGAGELNKQLLTKSADKIDQLEWIADVAIRIVDCAPRNGEGSVKTLIPRRLVLELAKSLEGAGKNVKYLRHDV